MADSHATPLTITTFKGYMISNYHDSSFAGEESLNPSPTQRSLGQGAISGDTVGVRSRQTSHPAAKSRIPSDRSHETSSSVPACEVVPTTSLSAGGGARECSKSQDPVSNTWARCAHRSRRPQRRHALENDGPDTANILWFCCEGLAGNGQNQPGNSKRTTLGASQWRVCEQSPRLGPKKLR